MDSLIAGGMPEMIVVMPDGDDGWYTTWNRLGTYDACLKDTTRKEPASSYCVPWTHYDDYIRRDVVHYVDSTYRTMADRDHRGIAGLSMGGYGAVSLALEYPGVWSAAASHSGVLSPMYLGPHPWNGHPVFAGTNAQLPEAAHGLWSYMQQTFGRDVGGWRARDPLTRVRHVLATQPARMPAMFMDVGQDDPFVDQNRAFDAELTALGVPHVFREWPGTHNWDYWRVHVAQSLVWMAGKIG
jgi:S-formylglutathione hydrolase FrmB